jgi:hypothetical protein
LNQFQANSNYLIERYVDLVLFDARKKGLIQAVEGILIVKENRYPEDVLR